MINAISILNVTFLYLNVIFLLFIVETRTRVGFELVRLINQFTEEDISILQQAVDNGIPFRDISEALFRYGDITGSNKDDALFSALTLCLKGNSLVILSSSFLLHISATYTLV